MNLKAVVYDMDGLLVDSMKHWLEFDIEFFKKRKIDYDPQIIKHFTGKTIVECMAWLKDHFNLVESVEELCHGRDGWIEKIYDELAEVMPGVDNLLKAVKQKGLKQAIATGAPKIAAEKLVDRFGWQGYFDQLVSVECTKLPGKPNPGVFLHAAKVLGVEPEHCVVLEDAENGVAAAKAAGMKCVAVPDKRWSFGDFSRADLAVDSLEDKRVFDFLGL
ncbi:MAG: HAD family phosphatase [Patescibacteria group bacterium]